MHRTTIRRGIVLALLALAVALPGYAQDYDVVSTVNDDIITRDEFHARVRFVRWQYLNELQKLYEVTAGNIGIRPDYVKTLVYNLQNPDVIGEAVLENMEEERLLWQAGEAVGVIPTAEEVDAREARFFALWTNVPADEIDNDPQAQAFIAQWYNDAIAISGLREDDLRYLFATETLRNKLYTYVSEKVPTSEMAVYTRHILCAFHPDDLRNIDAPTPEQRAAAEACIAEAQARLEAGESFAEVAADLSQDPGTAGQGGEMDWTLISYFTPRFADAVRDAELDTLIGPVDTEFGLHLIEVLGREMQTLDEQQLSESQYGYYQLWLQDQRNQATIERSDDWDADLPDDPGLDTLAPDLQDAIARVQVQDDSADGDASVGSND
jgi:hypothetical protein